MIWIDLKSKLPTDTGIIGWTPWARERWDAWLGKSRHLVNKLAELDAADLREERNALIDANSNHWSELKEWLLCLSAGKCWFSEVRELYSHYDIEHFRPKKEVKEFDGARRRDGYWWLAFNYMNFRISGTVGNRKKGGWFPLHKESMCSTYAHQCEESETPYLIDPVDCGDVSLIAFDEEGKVTPAPGISDWDVQRVNETIKRLRLNDYEPLSEERRKVWQTVDRLIKDFDQACDRCIQGPNPAASERMKLLGTKLREMMNWTSELSSVARWCLLLRNNHRLIRLVQ